MKSSILIADDEPLARRTLRQHLLDLGWAGPIHEAHDGETAIAVANDQRPDLVFLDIVMPGATGLEVLKQLDYEPKVIFTTAYDQYAVTAFELGALDYLLKPFGRDRLERVVRRAQAALNASAAPLLSRAKESLEQTRTLSRIFVRDGNRIIPIPLASLEHIQGADDYVTICTATKKYLVSLRLSDFEGLLRGASFLKIHRSHLINLEYITSIEPYDAAHVQVVMKSGARIIASRTGSKRLRGLAL
ncbi:MAG TPA: LytTR family DNA-binding domain-containing protein [Verrucomicrobiae bacterium]|jgi:two-component system LytT family response regulator|nr:LytTR family DNA-binding domain-containing protein [Verrucomicrobiae bacterium]